MIVSCRPLLFQPNRMAAIEIIRLMGDCVMNGLLDPSKVFLDCDTNVTQQKLPIGNLLLELCRLFWVPASINSSHDTKRNLPLYDVMCLAAEATSVLKRISKIEHYSEALRSLFSRALENDNYNFEWFLSLLAVGGNGVLSFLRPGVRLHSNATEKEISVADFNVQSVTGLRFRIEKVKNGQKKISYRMGHIWPDSIAEHLRPFHDGDVERFEKERQTTQKTGWNSLGVGSGNFGVRIEMSEVLSFLAMCFEENPKDEKTLLSCVIGLRYLSYRFSENVVFEDLDQLLQHNGILQQILKYAGEHCVYPNVTAVVQKHLDQWLEVMTGLLWFAFNDTCQGEKCCVVCCVVLCCVVLCCVVLCCVVLCCVVLCCVVLCCVVLCCVLYSSLLTLFDLLFSHIYR
jgi:hypothetical protein